ncbi:MAG: hypothetical protein WCK57_01750 [Verrucomicrobiae bacterium]
MASFFRPGKIRSWWLQTLPLGLALMLLGRSAAADQNTFTVGIDGTGVDPLINYLTSIHATNFYNGANGQASQFSFTTYVSSQNWLTSLYHNWYNTVNFTNVGEMDSVTGFNFDTQTSQVADKQAGSFYNVGSINCGTSANAIFLNQFFLNGFFYGGYGGINVWATNIYNINNSAINIGANGLARFGGNNVVFSNTAVTMQSQSGFISGSSTANVYATGQVDYNANDWSPSSALTQFYSLAPLNTTPYALDLIPSVPYFKVDQNNSGSNVVVRMIFLEDTSVNVTTNVYFVGGGPSGNLSNGTFYVEWIGNYTDPATGQSRTNYFYLNSAPGMLQNTNTIKYGNPGTGVPLNYNFLTSTTPLSLGTPETSSFVDGLLNSNNTSNNIYSYVDAQLITTSVTTNNVSLSNLVGRVEITASNTLNLSKATMSGMNYLLLKSPKQFDYDGRNQIAAPYADMYLGNTNGNLTVTNLIKPSLPVWSGSVQAYSSQWYGTNETTGVVYDYRLLMVRSQLSPVGSSQVQNFALYSSNNVVISDALNIYSSLSLNCTNLLLTTNGLNHGASSLDGELNLDSANIVWETAVPRLSCLTNNGAIRTLNSAKYGQISSPYLALVNTGIINNFGNITIRSSDLQNSGSITAGAGQIVAQTLTTTMNHGVIQASGAVSLTASNMVISGTSIQSGASLSLIATNLLTDSGVNSANYWSLGANNPSYGNLLGLVLPLLPPTGDLLGTTITNIAGANTTTINNTWAGQDRGYTTAGYKNNVAIGQLLLDAQTNTTQFHFSGTSTDGTTNAIYVDCLQLQDYAGYAYQNNANLPALNFDDNLVIYYAQALTTGGISVAKKINHFNNDHLRWVPTYAGHFSSTNIIYPNGTSNTMNIALATTPDLDSDRDGNPNVSDPTPVLVPSQLGFSLTFTNNPSKSIKLGWRTIPLAGNYIYYNTDLTTTNWLPFTNFDNYYYGTGIAVTNAAHTNYFVSPQPYIGGVTPSDNWETTNVWINDVPTNAAYFYRITVQPN